MWEMAYLIPFQAASLKYCSFDSGLNISKFGAYIFHDISVHYRFLCFTPQEADNILITPVRGAG